MPQRRIVHGAGIDTTDFRQFAKSLRKASPELSKNLRKQLRKAGEIVAEEARAKASEHSKTIAPTIKVSVASTSVALVAGGPDVPIAELYELGNRGGPADSFRHPVFGNDVWVSQKRYPFLKPAVHATEAQTLKTVMRALDDAIRTAVR